MVEKKKKMRFTDADLSLMKNTFAENEELLQALRKIMLQMDMSEADEKIVKGTFKGKKELISLMRKLFLPTLDPEAPRHQLIDLWMSVDIKEKPVDELMPVFQARKLLIDLINQQLEVLEGNVPTDAINISELTNIDGMDAEGFYVNLMARNSLITHVEQMLHQLEILSGQKDETPEQTVERLQKDSSR